jgi:carbamoyl-phosphate synthase large subunit
LPTDDTGHLQYPLIIKPRSGRGSRGVVTVADDEELRFHLARRTDEVIIQEKLEGEEYSIDLLADANGELRMVSTRRRLRVNAGISIVGEIAESTPFLADLERLTSGLKLSGPACVQCFLDADNQPAFTDLNPRLGGGVALSLRGGTPLLKGILMAIDGEEIPRVLDAGVGLRFLRTYDEIYVESGPRSPARP